MNNYLSNPCSLLLATLIVLALQWYMTALLAVFSGRCSPMNSCVPPLERTVVLFMRHTHQIMKPTRQGYRWWVIRLIPCGKPHPPPVRNRCLHSRKGARMEDVTSTALETTSYVVGLLVADWGDRVCFRSAETMLVRQCIFFIDEYMQIGSVP